MRFYDREKELGILQTNWEQTLERGRMTVLIGRREESGTHFDPEVVDAFVKNRETVEQIMKTKFED